MRFRLCLATFLVLVLVLVLLWTLRVRLHESARPGLATVPTENGSANYGRQQVIDVRSVTLADASANPIPAVADDAVHVVSYFADTSGNGRINAADAA